MRQLLRDQRKDLVMDMEKANQPLEKGLAQVNAHLKELNGKVATHSIKHATTDVLVDAVRQQVAGLLDERRTCVRREEDRGEPQGDGRRITQREVKLVLAVIGTYTGVLLMIWKVLPAVAQVLKATP
jgi:hypothetical protein